MCLRAARRPPQHRTVEVQTPPHACLTPVAMGQMSSPRSLAGVLALHSCHRREVPSGSSLPVDCGLVDFVATAPCTHAFASSRFLHLSACVRARTCPLAWQPSAGCARTGIDAPVFDRTYAAIWDVHFDGRGLLVQRERKLKRAGGCLRIRMRELDSYRAATRFEFQSPAR